MIVPPPVQQATASRDLVGRVVSFLNPRSIGKAVRLSRGWARRPGGVSHRRAAMPSVSFGAAYAGRVSAKCNTAQATVGYEDPLYYCLVQVGVPSVTIYAFEGRVDAVVHCGASVHFGVGTRFGEETGGAS